MAEKKNKENRKIKNIITLAVCLLIAFGMWVYVMSVDSPDHETVFDGVTVELTGTDALSKNNLAIFSGYGVKIDVTLAGKKSVVSKLSSDDVVVTADVSSVEASGRYNIKLNVDTPAGCKLVGMSQDTVSVYVDESGQITVELSEQFENTALPEGCYIDEVILPFDKVTVTGPLSMLNKIDSAVVILDMASVTKTTSITERIALVDAAGTSVENPYIDFFPREITVDIPIMKTVKVPLEVQFKNGFLSYDSVSVTVVPTAVEATGDAGRMGNENLVEPIVIDEKTAFETGRYDCVTTLEAAEGIELSINKAKVSVSLKSGYTVREFTVSEDRIKPVGENKNVKFTWSSSPVTVSILGPTYAVNGISEEDLSLFFDMSPYSDTNTGNVRVKAEVKMDSGYADAVLPVGQYYVNVTFE